jgi:hypothetical protein
MTIRILLPTGSAHKQRCETFEASVPNAAPAFDYASLPIGIVGHASVYYDPALGSAGKTLATQVFSRMARTIVACEVFFGMASLDFNVIIANLQGSGVHNGYGGAYHYGCDFTTGRTMYVDAAFGNPDRTIGLVVAELTECFMGYQNKGWNCGGSNGEALSRFLAELRSGGANGQLAPYTSAPAWDQAGRPNWIDQTENTDRNTVSTGCGVLYLWWMLSQGYTPAQITQAGGATLADNYAALVSPQPASQAWTYFSVALSNFPIGTINTDNPWS